MAESGNGNQNVGESQSGFKVTDRRVGRDQAHDAPQPAGEPAAAPQPGAAAQPPEARAGHEPPRKARPAPPIDFTTFVLSLASTALIQMGAAPDPETGKPTTPAPDLARQTIDILGMLREKTRGNLTDEESKFFDAVLYDLRMKFLEVAGGR